MKIVRIFGEMLWGLQWEDQKKDSFALAFEQWHDVEYLEAFFENHRQDLLHGFHRIGTVEEAVWSTLEEAKKMESRMLQLCRNLRFGSEPGIDIFFQPLHDQEFRSHLLSKRKAKGPNKDTWLRLYAIKIDTGCYIIVGSAIKLTRTMEERQHTKEQLRRLEIAREYLQREGVCDIGGFLEMVL